MGTGRRENPISEGRDRPLPNRMLLRDQFVGAGLHPLTVFISRQGVPNSGRLLWTSDADGDKAAALLIGAVALFASGDGWPTRAPEHRRISGPSFLGRS